MCKLIGISLLSIDMQNLIGSQFSQGSADISLGLLHKLKCGYKFGSRISRAYNAHTGILQHHLWLVLPLRNATEAENASLHG